MTKYLAFLSLSVVLFAGCSSMTRGSAPHKLVLEKRWVRDTPATDYLGGRRINRFQPILLDKLVIVGNAIDSIMAFDRDTAHLKWRISLQDGVEGGAYVNEGVLYFGAGDGQFYAVQADTGTVLWTYPLKAEGLGRPLVKGGVVYVLGGNNVAHCLDAKTGKLQWIYNRREASNISVRGASQPALVGDMVLIGFSDGALVALNRTSGAVVWEANLNHNKRFKDVDATPIIDGDNVYVSSYDGGLYSLQKADGKINWTLDDGGFEEVLIEGNRLYYSSTSGKLYAIDKGSGKVLWTKDNPQGVATGPVSFKGAIVVGELSGGLRFYDSRTGEFLTEFQPGRGVNSRAAVDPKKGEIYFISHDANLFALRADWRRFSKEWPWL